MGYPFDKNTKFEADSNVDTLNEFDQCLPNVKLSDENYKEV